MKRICHLKNNTAEVLLSTDDNILGMTYVPEFDGVLFVTDKNGNINFLGMDKFQDVYLERKEPVFDRIVYSADSKVLWMTSRNPFQIYFYEVATRGVIPTLGEYPLTQYRSYRESTPVFEYGFNNVAYDVKTNTLWLAIPSKHTILQARGSSIARAVGDGTKGFRYSTITKTFHLDSPSGVAWDKKNRILYVADTGNHLIYAFAMSKTDGDEIYLKKTYGDFAAKKSSEKEFFLPTTIVYVNNMLYVVDDAMKCLKRFDVVHERGKVLYTSPGKILDMDSVGENGQVLLEEV